MCFEELNMIFFDIDNTLVDMNYEEKDQDVGQDVG